MSASVTKMLVDKLNDIFGTFVEGIKTENLSVSLFAGTLVQENLSLKPEALLGLRLPLIVKSGTVRRVEISVPWHRLSSEPVVVEIDTVELLAATNYDLGHEALGELEQRIRGAIEAKLQRVKDAETARQESKVLDDSYMTKLLTRITENMRIKLTNFHVRFEDDGRGVSHPLAAGLVLSELSVQTADANWDTAGGTYMDPDGSNEARHKLLKMEGLEIYWRGVHRAELLTNKLDSQTSSDKIHVSIVCPSAPPPPAHHSLIPRHRP